MIQAGTSPAVLICKPDGGTDVHIGSDMGQKRRSGLDGDLDDVPRLMVVIDRATVPRAHRPVL